MHRQVRLGEDYRSGRAGRLGFIAELMKDLPDRCQAGNSAHRQTQVSQRLDAEQQMRLAAAVVELGNEVQTVHRFLSLMKS